MTESLGRRKDMKLNISAEKREAEKREMKRSFYRMPNGSRVKRPHNLYGEGKHRDALCRKFNRGNRNDVNMQLREALLLDPEDVDIVDILPANPLAMSKYITS